VHYAAGLNSLAALLAEEGEWEQALSLCQQSVRYTLRFFGKNLEYAAAFQNISWIKEQMGERGHAAGAMQEALRVFTAILGKTHSRTAAAAERLRELQEGTDA